MSTGIKMEDLHGEDRVHACAMKMWAFIKFIAFEGEEGSELDKRCVEMDGLMRTFLGELESQANEEFVHLVNQMKYNDSKMASA